MNRKSLLIVESPTKVKTIQKHLGNDYDVISCVGHVKDLPKKKLGIDIENEFKIELDVLPDKKKFISTLKKKSNVADRVLIATDPDREGEAIAAHLATEIPKEKLERVQFTEITKAGILDGIKNFRKINTNLVEAQTARRIIDRLVGYKVSPVLWATLQSNMKFVSTTLSAGRVQSAAVKLIVDRDRLRARFQRAVYHNLKATLSKNSSSPKFDANLVKLNGAKVCSSNDFDSKTGIKKNNNSLQLSETQAESLLKELSSGSWHVSSVVEKPRTSNPKPPFTTSTLQQEAASKLKSSPRQTMSTAQKLYENGFITYMRTDSTNLSKEAIEASRNIIKNKYGAEYLPKSQNNYATKVKNAQEAHEAIRPAHNTFRSVQQVEKTINKEAAKLYELIWKRTIASQMKPAMLKQTSILIVNQKAEFKTGGQVIVFPGYMKAYIESNSEGNNEKVIPDLKENDKLICDDLKTEIHKTKSPARFTEASLIKSLEQNGIGRPSTFASIIATIVSRKYVERKSSKLSPTFLGLAVTQLLENHYSNLVDKTFTAKMENGLDEISRGEIKSIPFIREFYFGGDHSKGLEKMLEEEVDISLACTIEIPKKISDSTKGRVGKFGPYLIREDTTKSIPENIYLGDLTVEVIEDLFKSDIEKDEPVGIDPESKDSVWIKKGPYGYYVQLGESSKRKGIPKQFPLEDVNLEYALKLLSLPRLVGKNPETNEDITADYGRFGPYIKCGKQNASIKGPETPLDITVEKSINLLANRNKKSQEIRTIGIHSESNKTIVVKDGRFGPYITDGKVNVSLRGEFTPDTISLEQSIELINKKYQNPVKKKRRKRK